MIKFNAETAMRVHDIFKEENKSSNPCILNVIDLALMFNTAEPDTKVLGTSYAYWEFLHACIDNIATGQWRTLPRMWIEYVCISRDNSLLEYQIEAEYRVYMAHREKTLKSIGLPHNPRQDPMVILYWIRRKKGEQYLAGIAHALLRMHLYFTQDTLEGIANNTSKGINPYDTVNQGIPPLKGTNKEEMLKFNFTDPYNQHDKMV